MTPRRVGLVFALSALAACAADGTSPASAPPPVSESPVRPVSTEAITLVSPNVPQAAMVGVPFRYDASKQGTAFSDPRRTGLTYVVTFAGPANGLAASGGEIAGVPITPGLQTVAVTARDTTGQVASQQFAIVVFGADLTTPTMPAVAYGYSDARVPLPRHFTEPTPVGGLALAADNTPAVNRTTDAGAALGRVLFYDPRLSVDDRVSCASCHVQQFAFSDSARLSRGVRGARTARHSMGLVNARFYATGRFFWDERAASLEALVLQPIQDPAEMALSLDALVTKLSLTSYYPALFTGAFGSPEITTDRVARALAQFTRSLVSTNAKIDRAFGSNGVPNFAAVFTAEEQLGQELFVGRAGCARCHGTAAHISDAVHNTGLDATITDAGAGNGRFKAPSLRNVAARAVHA